MEDEFEYPVVFDDDIEEKVIPQEEGFKKIKDQLARAEEDRDRAVREAQAQAQRASEVENLLTTNEQTYLKNEKERAENDLNSQEFALKTATDAGDSALISKLTRAMVDTKSRIERLKDNIARPVQNTQMPQKIQGAPTYGDLLESPELNSQQKQFLRDRPELRDSENLRIMFDQIAKENSTGEYTNWSQKWVESLDKRLEKNGVYGKSESHKNDREEPKMRDRSDDDGYGDRYGSPRESAPTTMGRGESRQSETVRNRNGTIRMTPEQRNMAESVADWNDGKYQRGLAYIDYAKKNSTPDRPLYETSPNGKITIHMDHVRSFNKSLQRGR
jgi:hypothetical protein